MLNRKQQCLMGAHLTMRRRWLRPVTWISLLAFPFGNMPGTLVGASHLLAAGSGHSRTCHDSGCRCCCPECLPDCDGTTGEISFSCTTGSPLQYGFAAQALTAASPDRDHVPCHSCPCSTGDCPHCNVANIPCWAAGIPHGIPDLCLGQHLAEIPLFFPSAHCGKLIRPPIT